LPHPEGRGKNLRMIRNRFLSVQALLH
jgi:hypothetical protein